MFRLTMPAKQAYLVADACRFDARMRSGDFMAIVDLCLDKGMAKDEYDKRYQAAQGLVQEAQKLLCTDNANDGKAAMALADIFDGARWNGEALLTEEQVKLLSGICEFYARVRMGQFNEIVWTILDMSLPTDDYCQRRDEAEQILLDTRKILYPELHGIGHSYGIGKFADADQVYDVHQVIRYALGHWRTPFSYHELPVCKHV